MRTPEHLLARQRALLAAVATDQRQNAWAQELFGRRNAVARWRGQTGCSIREVMQALDSIASLNGPLQIGRRRFVTEATSAVGLSRRPLP